MIEKIWFKDPAHFITGDNYSKFFPSKGMSFTEQLNSLMRLSIYFSIVIFLLKKDTHIFFVPIFMGGFTYFVYTIDTNNKTTEKLYLDSKDLNKDKHSNEICSLPSTQNPFMNVLMNEYVQNPTRAQACDISNKNIKKTTKKYFNKNLYRDVDDVFQKNASDRNYYTTPSTTIPNDMEAFAKFLFPLPKTCKEGSATECYRDTYRPISM